MIEISGRLLVDGRFAPGRLTIEEGRIRSVEFAPLDRTIAGMPYVAPGLVELHVHGYGGGDPVEQLEPMARALARHGTTSFQPTLFPAAPRQLGELCEQVAAAALKLDGPLARSVGIHLEGPFVNPERAGALPREDLAEPSVVALREILGPSTGDGRAVKTVTLAPELPGSADLIEELVRSGVRVSLGHSAAKASDARAAIGAGAGGVTHLFNAMSGVHHREPGLAGLALVDRSLTAEIIGDLVHVGAEAFELALLARGPQGLALVSDALRGAGTGCDVFHSHGREHVVRDGAAYYPPPAGLGDFKLAGTAMGQLDMVRRLVARGAVGIEDALTMATSTPARTLGLERELGVIAAGARADLLVLRGPQLVLERVLVGGVDVLV